MFESIKKALKYVAARLTLTGIFGVNNARKEDYKIYAQTGVKPLESLNNGNNQKSFEERLAELNKDEPKHSIRNLPTKKRIEKKQTQIKERNSKQEEDKELAALNTRLKKLENPGNEAKTKIIKPTTQQLRKQKDNDILKKNAQQMRNLIEKEKINAGINTALNTDRYLNERGIKSQLVLNVLPKAPSTEIRRR